jgi:hypothetical protein
MNRWLFALSWSFVALVAAYDSHFAWQHRQLMDTWELNPIALWATAAFGLGMVLAFKFVGLSFALGMAVYCRYRRPRLERPLTIIIGAAYALLLVHYSIGLMQPEHDEELPMNQAMVWLPKAPDGR